MINQDLENRFNYHAPSNEQIVIYTNLRNDFKQLAYIIESNTPKSREQSLALTKLEEALMWANAAIARNEGNVIQNKNAEDSLIKHILDIIAKNENGI